MKIVRLFDIYWDNKDAGLPNECIVIADNDWKPKDAALPLIEKYDCQAVMCSCEVLFQTSNNTDFKIERNSMITKKLLKAQAFFRYNVQEFLESVGAVKQDDGFILNTPIGQLNIHIYDCWIACRFEDVYAATVFTKGVSNRFSGKWNWLFCDDPVTLNNGLVIGDFVHAIERLLAYKPSKKDVAEAERLRTARTRYRLNSKRTQ